MCCRARLPGGRAAPVVREPGPAARAVRGEGARRPLAVPLLLQLDTAVVSTVVVASHGTS